MLALYRALLRELKSVRVLSPAPASAHRPQAPSRPNPTIVANLRALLEQSRIQDARNALLFLRSQREHQVLSATPLTRTHR
jgi:hypothetical protein